MEKRPLKQSDPHHVGPHLAEYLRDLPPDTLIKAARLLIAKAHSPDGGMTQESLRESFPAAEAFKEWMSAALELNHMHPKLIHQRMSGAVEALEVILQVAMTETEHPEL